MTESDPRLEGVRERIDEARDAAQNAEPDLLPQAGSPADEDTFEPSGDGANTGGNPVEGPDSDAPGDLDRD